jgi:hypothetical protein
LPCRQRTFSSCCFFFLSYRSSIPLLSKWPLFWLLQGPWLRQSYLFAIYYRIYFHFWRMYNLQFFFTIFLKSIFPLKSRNFNNILTNWGQKIFGTRQIFIGLVLVMHEFEIGTSSAGHSCVFFGVRVLTNKSPSFHLFEMDYSFRECRSRPMVVSCYPKVWVNHITRLRNDQSVSQSHQQKPSRARQWKLFHNFGPLIRNLILLIPFLAAEIKFNRFGNSI